MAIIYALENNLFVDEFIDILVRSTLAERRPINEPERIAGMISNANMILTARLNKKLIAVSRAMTDFYFCTYLSDLAVDKAHQRIGIDRELIRQTKLQTPMAKLILPCAPGVINYYGKIGMTKFEECFFLEKIESLQG